MTLHPNASIVAAIEIVDVVAVACVVAAGLAIAFAFAVVLLDRAIRDVVAGSLSSARPQNDSPERPSADVPDHAALAEYLAAVAAAGRQLSRTAHAVGALAVAVALLVTAGVLVAVDKHDERNRAAAAAADDEWLHGYDQITTGEPIVAYRVYGGASDRRGSWATDDEPRSRFEATAELALPPGNLARCVATITIHPGTTVRIGRVAPMFGYPGGAGQLQIIGPGEGVTYETDRALPPSEGPCPPRGRAPKG
jgi:hypothetical protein